MCLGTAHSTAWSISVRLGSFADLGWTLMCLGLAGAAELTGLCSSSLRPAQQYFLSKVGKQGRDPKGVERLMHRLELIPENAFDSRGINLAFTCKWFFLCTDRLTSALAKHRLLKY